MINFDFEQNCYGCGLCAKVFSQNTIEMIHNFEGFVMPKVDPKKCIQCGLCDAKCPHITVEKSKTPLEQSECKAAFRRDDSRMNSVSGGVAAVISEEFAKQGGVVIGCAWDEQMVARYIAVRDSANLPRLQSSKYVQSDMSAVLCLTKRGIECDKMLEFFYELFDTTIEDILRKNQPLVDSVGRGGNREGFFKELDRSKYSKAAQKYGGKYNPLKYYGVMLLDKAGLFENIKRYSYIKG